jgi:hypothetical protein
VSDDSAPVLSQPWFAPDPAHTVSFEREALAEIGPGHVLDGQGLVVIARCSGCDDLAFRVDDNRFAIVHLIWKGGQERPPWPSARIFSDWGALEDAARSDGH